MKSVIYKNTGRFNAAGIEETEEVFLRDTRGKSLFKNGDRNSGLDARLNAPGDVADSATGYQIAMDTLTYINKRVSEQKFYDVPVADFIPLAIGEGSFAGSILTQRTYANSGPFESGNIRTAANNTRLAQADVSIDSKTMQVQNWAVACDYSIFDVEQALFANNWDIIEQKHRARKKMWDLGIQQTAFLGQRSNTLIPGLLNSTEVNANTSVITKNISAMTAAEFQTFVGTFIATYFSNANSTVLPNRLIIPMADFLGLQAAASETYPNITKFAYLEMAFKGAAGPDFKILPLAYAQKATNNALTGLNKNVYVLYRYDPETLRMDIPTDYTTTQAGSMNNFQFTDVAYGQYTGVGIYRQLEVLLFTW